jgi:predicted Zn-dependent protease
MIPAILAITLTPPKVAPMPRVEHMVARAWREAEDDQASVAEKRHQEDLKRDREIGKKYSLEVEKELKVVTDKELQERIDRIGNEIAQVANSTHAIASWGDKRMNTFDYTFKIVEDKKTPNEVNAFSLPGGYIYVYKGLIDFAESDDELAGVLAHEVAHAAFRHVATIQSEQAKQQKISIPLILAAVILGGTGAVGPALSAGAMVGQAYTSGWSVSAEKAADYGGFQYMLKSKYDPTGLLTFMERLAAKDRSSPTFFDLGIYRTHPPGRERADALIKYMKDADLPIRRSRVASSLRAEAKPADNGTVVVTFGGKSLVSFAGNDAITRADAAVDRLNNFFDSVPEMYEVQVGDGGEILGRRQELLALTQADAAAAKTSMSDLQKATLAKIRGALFRIGYRVWDVR